MWVRKERKEEGHPPTPCPELTQPAHCTHQAAGGYSTLTLAGSAHTCEVDMREVSCRPVRSEEEMLTGAPRCSRILTFRSRSMPDTGRGEVLAEGERTGRVSRASERDAKLQKGSLLGNSV